MSCVGEGVSVSPSCLRLGCTSSQFSLETSAYVTTGGSGRCGGRGPLLPCNQTPPTQTPTYVGQCYIQDETLHLFLFMIDVTFDGRSLLWGSYTYIPPPFMFSLSLTSHFLSSSLFAPSSFVFSSSSVFFSSSAFFFSSSVFFPSSSVFFFPAAVGLIWFRESTQ